MFITYNFLEKDISKFLNGSDFISFICTNKTIYNSLIKELTYKKINSIRDIINKYYLQTFSKFSLKSVSEKKYHLY